MIKYQYKARYSSKFKKSLKFVLKQGKDIEKLLDIIDILANKEKIDIKYQNHHLNDNKYFKDCMELHIEPDWLLIYKYLNDELILLLVDTGSHSDLF